MQFYINNYRITNIKTVYFDFSEHNYKLRLWVGQITKKNCEYVAIPKSVHILALSLKTCSNFG